MSMNVCDSVAYWEMYDNTTYEFSLRRPTLHCLLMAILFRCWNKYYYFVKINKSYFSCMCLLAK